MTTPPSTSYKSQLPEALPQASGPLLDPAARRRDGSQPYYPHGTGPFFSNRSAQRRNARPTGAERRKKMILQQHFAKRKRRVLAALELEIKRDTRKLAGLPLNPQAAPKSTDLTPTYWEESL